MQDALLNLALWLASGILLGWLAFALININARYPVALNMLVGALGAVTAGASLLGSLPDLLTLNLTALCLAPMGALFALGLLAAFATTHRPAEKIRILLH